MKKLIFLVFFLTIPLVNAQTCYDSDNGLNYYQAGYVKFDDTTYYDECVNNKTLIEGYCEDDKFNVTTYYCPYACKDGACVLPSTIETKITQYHPTVSEVSIAAVEEWLLNPWFTNPALEFDTGIVENQTVAESPDDWKWGYSCYKWNDGINPIDWCQVKAYYAGTVNGQPDYNVYLAGDSLGFDKTGVVKLVQGNVWGGSVPWYIPQKIPINGRNIFIDAWYNVGYSEGFLTNYLFDVWLKDDSTGHIMVLDLMFFRVVPLRSPWWDGNVFHYQADVCGAGGWYHCNFKLNSFIDDAISAAEAQGVHFNRARTYLYQAEILFELIHGVAELDVGGFRLYSTPVTTTTIRGGSGCPILKAWNGKEFKEIEKLNIHAPKDEDVTYSTTFKMKPINGEYELILKEAAYLFWDGSHIDSVSLRDEKGNECKLISAIHSKKGDVLPLIKESDDSRVRTYPGEEIKLVYTGCEGEEFTFSIEGYNMKWTGVFLGLNYTDIIMILITIALVVIVIFVFKFFMRRG